MRLGVSQRVTGLGWGVDYDGPGWCIDIKMIRPAVMQALVGSEGHVVVLGHVAIAPKHLLVTAEHDLVFARQLAPHSVVSVRVGGVEVEDKEEVASLGDDDLVPLVLLADVLMWG